MKDITKKSKTLNVFQRTFPWRFLLSSILVSVAILLDNAVDLGPMLRAGTGSLYYFFMGSISLGGLFGVYFAPLLCVAPYHRVKSLALEKESVRNNSFYNFCASVLYGGCVLGFGYLLLFLLLKCGLPVLMPYELEDIMENSIRGVPSPYEKYFISSSGLRYFASAIWLGFWTGCLYGGASILAYCFSQSYSLALLSPYLCMLWTTYMSKYAGIPDMYRLDMWMKMRSIISSEEQTLLFSALLTLIILCGMYLIYAFKVRRIGDGKRSRDNESSISNCMETSD